MENTNSEISKNENLYNILKLNEGIFKVFYFYNEFLLKEFCVPITSKFRTFINEESIMLDEKSLNSIDDTTKLFLEFILDNLESAFIKVNFSSGSDSYFMVNKLRCSILNEILILIKSSTKLQENLLEEKQEITKDNYSYLNYSSSNKLFLKKWNKLEMRREFRIVWYKNCILISQRYCDVCFDYNKDELDDFYQIIKKFFKEKFVFENFRMETKIFYLNDENNKITSKNESLNYLDFHFITKNDIDNEIIYLDFIILKSKKIKILDLLTEEQRNKLAYKLDDYDIKNFSPLLFEKFKNSEIFKNKVSKQSYDQENIIAKSEKDLDEEFIENENKYFKEFIKEYIVQMDGNLSDYLNEMFLYIKNNDGIIIKDENFNKFPQELIDNPTNMIHFLENLDIKK